VNPQIDDRIVDMDDHFSRRVKIQVVQSDETSWSRIVKSNSI